MGGSHNKSNHGRTPRPLIMSDLPPPKRCTDPRWDFLTGFLCARVKFPPIKFPWFSIRFAARISWPRSVTDASGKRLRGVGAALRAVFILEPKLRLRSPRQKSARRRGTRLFESPSLVVGHRKRSGDRLKKLRSADANPGS
jgi:hypothetical protein